MSVPGSNTQIPHKGTTKDIKLSLHFLTAHQARAIDRAIGDVGEHGEVRLQVHRGRLRLIAKVKSKAVNI